MAVLDVGRLLTMVRQRVAETVAAGDGVTSGGDASGAAAPMAGNVLPGERPPGQWRARR
jgi:hypothetical protein